MMMVSRSAVHRSSAPTLVPESVQSWSATESLPQPTRPICALAMFGADLAGLFVALAVGVLVTTAVGDLPPSSAPLAESGPLLRAMAVFAGSALAVLAYLTGQSHYQQRIPFWTTLQTVLFASTAALLFNVCMIILLREHDPVVLPVVAWLVFPLASMVARKIARQMLTAAGLWTIRTIMVGDPVSARQTLAALASEPILGYDVVAVINPGQVNALMPGRRWRTLLQHHNAGLLVLSYDASTAPSRNTVESLVRERIPFAVMPQGGGLPILGFEQTRFFSHDTVMFSYRNNLAQPLARRAKVVFDVVAVCAGLLVLSPVLGLIALLVKLDGGPVLFSHTRIGANGRRFGCLKFRSMVINSDAVLNRLLASDPAAAAEWARTHKLRNDPRITRIGRFLRTTSLDELPQLFNVLRLEMSLVGPRPIVEAEIERYGDDITYYYETRPGLTGLWQVSGRTGTSYAQRVQLDTWYVKNWTIWHDVAIIAKTVPAVLTRKGAC